MQISVDDPLKADVVALLEGHLSDMRATSPPESVHALDPAALVGPGLSFWTLREDGVLLGCAALKELDLGHAEIKSMRTAPAARRRGVASRLLDHVLATAGGGSGATDPVSLSPAIPTDELYPGGQASVGLIVANPNPADVRIGSLVLDTSQGTNGFDVDEDHAGCALTTLAFTTQTNAGAGWSIPANGSLPITLTGALSMTSDAANACQGATFQIYLTATG